MKQSHIFLHGEGLAWGARNNHKLPPETDPAIDAIIAADIPTPISILEIGCGNGWRLARLARDFGADVYGIDPACNDSRKPRMVYGTADRLPAGWENQFDLVIYGFMLYVVDREDLFRIAAEGNRVLKDGGHIVIQDFQPEYPYSRPYEHAADVMSYKMDYSSLWLASPAYRNVYTSVSGTGDDRTSVAVLKKDIKAGWPVERP